MKRYIRTKDGHIVDISVYKKVVERTFNGKVVAIDLNHWGQDSDKEITFIPVGDIARQADTIEELCDEFVIKGTRVLYLGIPLQSCELKNIPITQIRGAIWTDKGLIYVAKMNEKMELEVL